LLAMTASLQKLLKMFYSQLKKNIYYRSVNLIYLFIYLFIYIYIFFFLSCQFFQFLLIFSSKTLGVGDACLCLASTLILLHPCSMIIYICSLCCPACFPSIYMYAYFFTPFK
jgi:hypothetical protein